MAIAGGSGSRSFDRQFSEADVESGVPRGEGRSGDVGEPSLPAAASGLAARTLAALTAEEGIGTIPAQERVIGPLHQDRDLVFAREDGAPVHPEAIGRALRRIAKAAGVRPVRTHDLRHGWATAALEAGVHPKVVSDRLGHSKVSVTLDVYSHVARRWRRRRPDWSPLSSSARR